MDTLKKINMPEQEVSIAANILDFLTTFIPYSVVFGVFWKFIDAVLKYASDGRDSRTRELIQEETKGLKTDIKDLTKSIWALTDRIENIK